MKSFLNILIISQNMIIQMKSMLRPINEGQLQQNFIEILLILTENAKFDPLRVKILNLSQRIRDFQPKISRNTCLTRFFWIFHRKVTQGVPFGILILRFSVFWRSGGSKFDRFCSNLVWNLVLVYRTR